MKFLRTATLAAAAAFVVLTPTAAHADTLLRYDTTGDVVGVTYDEETETETYKTSALRKQGDIYKVKTYFEGETVRISAMFQGLFKTGPFMFHSIRLVTSKVERSVDVLAAPGAWTGESQMSTRFGSPHKCTSLTHKIDWTYRVVTVTFARSCLSVNGFKPGAVRVGWGTGTIGANDQLFLDDGFLNGPITGDNPLTLSKTVYR